MLARIAQVLTLLGGGGGLLVVAGAAFAALRSMSGTPPGDWRDDPWRFVIVGFGAMPFALALLASLASTARWATRCALLAASTLLAFAIAVVTGFSIGFLFLPPAALLAVGTVAALAHAPRAVEGAPLAALVAVGVVALWVAGAAALFAGPDTERCWATVIYLDGRVERSVFGHPAGEPIEGVGSTTRSGGLTQGVSCASDVVTASEGLTASSLLLGAAGLARLALRRATRGERTLLGAGA